MEQDPLLTELLIAGAAHCVDVAQDNAGTLTGLFLVGLSGGISHCAGMCGPFVLSQVSARLEAVPVSEMSEFRRLTGAALLPYHLGRTLTYTALGVGAAAVVATGAAVIPGMRWFAFAMLLLAAFLFLSQGLKNLGIHMPRLFDDRAGDNWLATRLGAAARGLFARPVGWRGFALGLILGLLPCGLVYGALAAAVSSQDMLTAGMMMTAFALGTIPSLFVVGFAGHAAGRRWPDAVRLVAPIILIGNAAWLAYMAWTVLG